MIYVLENIKIPLWKLLQGCLQNLKKIPDKVNRSQEKMSKNNENTEIQNDETKSQNCKPMISSLYGLENKIRNKENVEDISKLGNSFHNEAASFLTLDHCNDHQLEELKQLSGNK